MIDAPSAPAFDPPADRLRVVLVGTQHPGNIGSAARAMKTMGLRRLVLVAPERALDADAHALAAGADDVLAAATTVPTLADAVADCRLVFGSTARGRRIALEERWPRAAAAQALATAADGGDVALVFGRERTGLTNDELQLCHAAIFIPADPDYSSLNLAAAVQVVTYELRLAALELGRAQASSKPAGVADRVEPPATHAQMEGFFGQLGEVLDLVDFHKGRTPDAAMRKLRRLFARAAPDAREVRLLRGVLADVERAVRFGAGR